MTNENTSTLKCNWKEAYICVGGGVLFEPATITRHHNINSFNPLIALPSPRDIVSVKKAIDESLQEYDKAWFKYFTQSKKPYTLIRKYFLKHKKYTHLIILPDDLVIHRAGVEKLINAVEDEPEKYKVLMAICNVEYGQPYVIFTKNHPSLKHSERKYDWYTWSELAEYFTPLGIIQVKYCGTPFAIISRDLIENGIVTLEDDAKWNNIPFGSSEDVVLSHDLLRHNIPLYVDTSVCFEHLKGTAEYKVP